MHLWVENEKSNGYQTRLISEILILFVTEQRVSHLTKIVKENINDKATIEIEILKYRNTQFVTNY